MKRQVTQWLEILDPDKDYEELKFLLQCYESPWDCERPLEFTLFRTFAVPWITALLYQTGEFMTRPRTPYDDTELILFDNDVA